ncbi:unnamed protein product [Phytophthora lilii]|uniref:Unnamed protein product n=1 Tax=Phytophthora lilii TaxID=2077276 RepID=A0A9W6WXY5_9STRA|nr:unnamed protein product [Phytophthora lilii]
MDQSNEASSASVLSLAVDSRVQEPTAADTCKQKCLTEKEVMIEQLIRAIDAMTAKERKVSVAPALTVLEKAGAPGRSRSTGHRQRFGYFLPFVGLVYREAFYACYGVSAPTIVRYNLQIVDGFIGVKRHDNQNALTLDADWIVQWLNNVASSIGEVVPARVRRQKLMES